MPLKDLYFLSGDTKFLREFFFLSKLEMFSSLKSERTPKDKMVFSCVEPKFNIDQVIDNMEKLYHESR